MSNKILVLLEHFDDGQGEPQVYLDTPDGRANMDADFRKAVRENIGERDFDGDVRALTEDEIAEEIEQAIRNDYDWSGWDCKVQTFFCEVEDERKSGGLPWAVFDHTLIENSNGEWIGDFEYLDDHAANHANALMAVHAVNHHDARLDALHRIAEQCELAGHDTITGAGCVVPVSDIAKLARYAISGK